MYSQIFTFLFIILIAYYVAMIALDLYKDKKMKEMETENASENDIDISDEAKNFKTIFISRDDSRKTSIEKSQAVEKVKTQIPKEATMTGAIPVEDLTEKIRNFNGSLPEDLGDIVHKCQAA